MITKAVVFGSPAEFETFINLFSVPKVGYSLSFIYFFITSNIPRIYFGKKEIKIKRTTK